VSRIRRRFLSFSWNSKSGDFEELYGAYINISFNECDYIFKRFINNYFTLKLGLGAGASQGQKGARISAEAITGTRSNFGRDGSQSS